MANPKIPSSIFGRTLSQKDARYNEIISYLLDPLNRPRLGLTGVTALDDANTRLVGPPPGWNFNYPKSISSGNRTKNIIDARNGDGIYIEDKLDKVYGEIPDSALSTDDRNILHIPKRNPKSSRPQIDVSPTVSVKNLAGGWLQFINRRDSDSTRASRHPDSDGVEIGHSFDVVPGTADAVQFYFFSSRARFPKDFSLQIGKTLYGYARWKNVKEPEKSGPWSPRFTIIVGS